MRTNIEVDDKLIAKAMKISGAQTKRAVVDAGLRLIVQMDAQASIRKLRGKVKWEGDLEGSRLNRLADRET